MKHTTFPHILYVITESGADDQMESFLATRDIDDASDGEKVAVYRRVEIKTKQITHALK